MSLQVPEFCLIALLGPLQSGLLDFARRNFPSHQILQLQQFQDLVGMPGEVPGDEARQALALAVELRLKNRLRTIVIGVEPHPRHRAFLRQAARRYHAQLSAWLFLPALSEFEGKYPQAVISDIAKAIAETDRESKVLKEEGFNNLQRFESLESIQTAQVKHFPLSCDQRADSGPWDVIGAVHGCFEEWESLVQKLGYGLESGTWRHPEGRKLAVLGDLADFGPEGKPVAQALMRMCAAGHARVVRGNQDNRLLDILQGKLVTDAIGLEPVSAWAEQMENAEKTEMIQFLEALPSHLVLDQGKLVLTHAGIKPDMVLRDSPQVSSFCWYGETPAERAVWGFPALTSWAEDFTGDTIVLHAHQAVHQATWHNKALNLDTGCVFGGKLSAFRYPEMELVHVPAQKQYHVPERVAEGESDRDQGHAAAAWQVIYEHINGAFLVQTRLGFYLNVVEAQAVACLQHFSHETVDPRWLIYLPPSMSPPQSAKAAGYLEHLDEGFSYFEKKGLTRVFVQEKMEGRRAVVVLCQSPEVAKRRFGVEGGAIGSVYSRHGRPLFQNAVAEREFLDVLQEAMQASELWSVLKSDWVCLEGELSLGEGLSETPLSHSAAAMQVQGHVDHFLKNSIAQGEAWEAFQARMGAHAEAHLQFAKALAQRPEAELRFSPYHLLASEGKTYFTTPYGWQLEQLSRLCAFGKGMLRVPQHLEVELGDIAARGRAAQWWESLSETGRPGVIVKADQLLTVLDEEPIQPAIKVRGKNALRYVYGPLYDMPEALALHRNRSLKARRELTSRQFALGYESLSLFVEGRPFAQVHQMVFTQAGISSVDADFRL